MEGLTLAGEGSKLGWADVAVIACYFVCVLAVGLYSSYKSQRGTVSGYFLAARGMHWLPVGASLFASNIGSGHFIGLAGSGAASGLAVNLYEQGSIYTIMMLGWLFVPVYLAAGVYTMPEYLRLRFGGQRIRVYLSFLALLLYIFTKISADLYAGALFIQLALNKSSAEWLYLSILFLLVVAAAFTIAGGLTAVVWTDFVQTILMVLGALVLMTLALKEVGGLQGLVEKYPLATAAVRGVDTLNRTCGEPPEDFFHFLRSSTPGVSNYPWIGMIFGLRINSIWYWCTDQVIVQRTLASRNLSHAKAGCIVAGYLKFLPMWLLIIPGMAARVLFPNRVACASPEECLAICGSAAGCSNIAYPELVINLLPTGLAGLMLAVMMAALMTSLTSIFNSASTIFTLDVWMLIRGRGCVGRAGGRCCGGGGGACAGRPTDRELLVVGRLFVVVLVAISVIWIPVIQNTGSSQLFTYIQSISSFLAPPIAAVFILAVFWPRATEPGAFWGLMAGLAVGLCRFVLQFAYVVPPCGSDVSDTRPWLIRQVVDGVHFLHFSLILWFLTGVVTISVSLLTPPIPKECLYRLTFWSRKDTRVRRPLRPPRPPATQQETEMIRAGPDRVEEGKKKEEEEEERRREAVKAVEILKETPTWRRVVNWNAVICLVISTFVVGFFA
ncbi:sodium/glucose cotransporter 5-like [Eriocheir sinensis]|uniref:sodium/glucose cotransporter 5-like n=1 Tax=Eriocheir sinensis TaxID=95602 RepID=UPI0021C9973D|nr:sodium/glucose cotransporter 5-like [Eriocheir sinensis]